MKLRQVRVFFGVAVAVSTSLAAELFAANNHDLVAQVDIDRTGSLSRPEVLVGLENLRLANSLNLPAMRAQKAIPKALLDDLEKRSRERLPNGRPGPLALLVLDFERKHGATEPWSIDEVNPQEFGLATMDREGSTSGAELAAQAQIVKWDFKVRRSKQDLGKPIGDAYAQGAVLSYAHNYNKERDTWTARGVAQYTYSLVDNPAYDPLSVDPNSPRGAAAIPGPVIWNSLAFDALLSWDKVDVSPGKEGEVDSLRLDIGLTREATLTKDAFLGALIKGFQLRGSGFFVTDFEFDKKIFGAEVESYIRFNLPGCARTARLFTDPANETGALLDFRWTPWIHGEGGRVEEGGSSDTMRSYDTFARFGGGIALELWPFPEALKNRLSIEGKYLHYEGLASDVEASHLLSVSAQYVLPIGSGYFSSSPAKGVADSPDLSRERAALVAIRVEYTDGEMPITQERDHFFLFGIGVAF